MLDRIRRQEPIYDETTLDRYVQQDLAILRDFKPHIVVGDQRHSLAISSQLAGVPYVNISDAHWSPAVDIGYEITDSPVTQTLGVPLSNLIFQFIHPVTFAFQTMPLNLVRAKYKLPGIGLDIKIFFTYGDHTVYPNDPELFPLKERLPPGHSFIGPLIWSPAVEVPDWWDQLPADRAIVYVSLGSTGQSNLLETIFNVLGKLPVTVMAATAARKKLPGVPENVFIADFLPGILAARRSRLVICNGGAMSGQQALSAGTPYLGLISNLDQLLFSKAVRRTGACEWMREGEVNDRTLGPVIRRMLAQAGYQAAAKRVAASSAKLEPAGSSRRSFARYSKVAADGVSPPGRRPSDADRESRNMATASIRTSRETESRMPVHRATARAVPHPAQKALDPRALWTRRFRISRYFFGIAVHFIWWDYILNRSWLSAFRSPWVPRWHRLTERYRELALELQGVWVKLGQFLSTRVDVLPLEITRESSRCATKCRRRKPQRSSPRSKPISAVPVQRFSRGFRRCRSVRRLWPRSIGPRRLPASLSS